MELNFLILDRFELDVIDFTLYASNLIKNSHNNLIVTVTHTCLSFSRAEPNLTLNQHDILEIFLSVLLPSFSLLPHSFVIFLYPK